MSILARPLFNSPPATTETKYPEDKQQWHEEGVEEVIIDEGIIVWRRSVLNDEDGENHDEFLTEWREHREEGEAPNR